tara:strand:+ start:192 stop:632 length:441 start_codon:yes stop_codon:yes gene_type:complete
MPNWNLENSECLQDCKNTSNIDNNLLYKNEPSEIGYSDEEMLNNKNPEVEESESSENFRNHRRRIGDMQYIGYGRPRYRRRFFPFFYREPVIINRNPVIVRRDPIIVEKPVVHRDPEMHFGVEKLVILLIILIMFIMGGFYLLRKN